MTKLYKRLKNRTSVYQSCLRFCNLWKVERLEQSISEPVTQRTGVTNRSSEPISNRVVLREIETQTEEVKPQVKIAPQRSSEVPKQDTKAKAALGTVVIFFKKWLKLWKTKKGLRRSNRTIMSIHKKFLTFCRDYNSFILYICFEVMRIYVLVYQVI